MWINFLLKEGKGKIENWEEEDVVKMNKLGIEFIPYCKLHYDTIQYAYNGNEYTLYVNELSDFSIFFSENDEMDEKTIRTILSGEGADLFEPYVENIHTVKQVISEYIDDKDKIKLFNILKPICLKYSDVVKDISELSELVYHIDKDDELDDVKDAVITGTVSSIVSMQENEAYKELKKAIEKTYDLEYIDYQNDKFVYKASKSGLNKLFLANWLTDLYIDYKPPYYGYSGSFEVDWVIEYIVSYLE